MRSEIEVHDAKDAVIQMAKLNSMFRDDGGQDEREVLTPERIAEAWERLERIKSIHELERLLVFKFRGRRGVSTARMRTKIVDCRLRAMSRSALVLLFSAAFGLWAQPSAAQEIGFVELQGIPLGAEVFVDGEPWPTPLNAMGPQLLELAPGSRRIRVTGEGFEPFARTVRVVDGEIEIIRVELERIYVAVRLIHLLPAEVGYYLPTSRRRGITPASITVPVGEQVFEINGELFCFRLKADSAAYIRIRSGVVDELQRTTECEVPSDWLVSGNDPVESLYRLQPPVPRGLIIPPDNERLRGTGDVQVWVFVDERGRVVPDSTRLEPPTPDADFNRRLIREASEWVFLPARRDGQAVASWFPYRIGL